MKHFADEWIKEWCEDNGWTDLVFERNLYWAFPPGAVMPEPIPSGSLRTIKANKGLSREEKIWLSAAGIMAISAAIISLLLKCPMPLVFAFAFNAITMAQLEIEEI